MTADGTEGPIVQSFYDLALLSWSLPLKPPLPLVTAPPTYPPSLTASNFEFGPSHPLISTKGDLSTSASKARQTLAEHHAATETVQDEQDDKGEKQKEEVWDRTNADEADRVDGQFASEQAITEHLSEFTVGQREGDD